MKNDNNCKESKNENWTFEKLLFSFYTEKILSGNSNPSDTSDLTIKEEIPDFGLPVQLKSDFDKLMGTSLRHCSLDSVQSLELSMNSKGNKNSVKSEARRSPKLKDVGGYKNYNGVVQSNGSKKGDCTEKKHPLHREYPTLSVDNDNCINISNNSSVQLCLEEELKDLTMQVSPDASFEEINSKSKDTNPTVKTNNNSISKNISNGKNISNAVNHEASTSGITSLQTLKSDFKSPLGVHNNERQNSNTFKIQSTPCTIDISTSPDIFTTTTSSNESDAMSSVSDCIRRYSNTQNSQVVDPYIPNGNDHYMRYGNVPIFPYDNSHIMPYDNYLHMLNANKHYMSNANGPHLLNASDQYMRNANGFYMANGNMPFMPNVNGSYIPNANVPYIPSANDPYIQNANHPYMPNINDCYMIGANFSHTPNVNGIQIPSANGTLILNANENQGVNDSGTRMPTANGTHVPNANGSHLPNANGIHIPNVNSTSVPKSNGTRAPSTNGIHVPSINNRIQNANGTHIPKTNGTRVPKTNGTRVPKTNGTHVPKTNGTYFPKTNGTYIPKTNGIYIPKTNGIHIPNANGIHASNTNMIHVPNANISFRAGGANSLMPNTHGPFMPLRSNCCCHNCSKLTMNSPYNTFLQFPALTTSCQHHPNLFLTTSEANSFVPTHTINSQMPFTPAIQPPPFHHSCTSTHPVPSTPQDNHSGICNICNFSHSSSVHMRINENDNSFSANNPIPGNNTFIRPHLTSNWNPEPFRGPNGPWIRPRERCPSSMPRVASGFNRRLPSLRNLPKSSLNNFRFKGKKVLEKYGRVCRNCEATHSRTWKYDEEGRPFCNTCRYFHVHHRGAPSMTLKNVMQGRNRKGSESEAS